MRAHHNAEMHARSRNTADTSDVPFRPVIECVLDIPPPPSTNKIRRIDWNNHKAHKEWRKQAGLHLMKAGQFRGRLRGVERYELTIILDEKKVKIDPDNVLKCACDLLKNLNVIVDDAPQNARRIVVEWGEAPTGCRIILRPVKAGWKSLASIARKVVEGMR